MFHVKFKVFQYTGRQSILIFLLLLFGSIQLLCGFGVVEGLFLQGNTAMAAGLGEEEDAETLFDLGMKYLKGDGVPQD